MYIHRRSRNVFVYVHTRPGTPPSGYGCAGATTPLSVTTDSRGTYKMRTRGTRNGQQRVLAWVEVGSRWLSCGPYSSAGSGREQPRARQRTGEASRAVPNQRGTAVREAWRERRPGRMEKWDRENEGGKGARAGRGQGGRKCEYGRRSGYSQRRSSPRIPWLAHSGMVVLPAQNARAIAKRSAM